MASDIERAGQALLNAEMRQGLTAKDAELHALRMGQILAPSSAASGEASKKIKALQAEVQRLALQVQMEQGYSNKATRDIKELNETLLGWTHSSEAFKRVARSYGKRLGLSDDARQQDMDRHLLEVAEEDPTFQATNAFAKAKEREAGRLATGQFPQSAPS